jgi:hypothetical protein
VREGVGVGMLGGIFRDEGIRDGFEGGTAIRVG